MGEPEGKRHLLGNSSEEEDEVISPGEPHQRDIPTTQSINPGSSPAVGSHPVYARRWYCLATNALLCFVSGMASTSFGPVAHTSEIAFGWNTGDIALMTNWQPITYILSIAFFSWLIDNKGLRVSFMLSGFFTMLGTAIRCVTSTPPLSTLCFHVGQVLIGVAATVVFAAPTTFSNTWFPPNQRTSATAVAAMANGLGSGLGAIIGPLVVKAMVPGHRPNSTAVNGTLVEQAMGHNLMAPVGAHGRIREMRLAVMVLMYKDFILAGLVFVMILAYFPAKPPTPPSVSASSNRMPFTKGCKIMMRRSNFWILTAVYSISGGVSAAMSGVLDVLLKAAQVPGDQEVAGWISFAAVICVVAACIIFSILADRFSRHVKPLLIGANVLGVVFFTWFALIVHGTLKPSIPGVYVSFTVGSMVVSGTLPVLQELACDATYPVAEGLTTGAFSYMNNFTMLTFLFILMIPRIGSLWLIWANVAAVAVCIPILLPFKAAPPRGQITLRPIEGHEDEPRELPYPVPTEVAS